MHADASSSSKAPGELKEFFSVEGKDVLATYAWNFHMGALRALYKAPAAVGPRLRAAAFVARASWWHRIDLWQEAKVRFRSLARN
jgi:hypothetical protein